jgi:hypothetical protein
MPAVYARIASEFIHEPGPHRALADFRSFVGTLLDQADETICSRVDIYLTFQGWVPGSEDYHLFIIRSRRNTSLIAVHHTTVRESRGSRSDATQWWQGSMSFGEVISFRKREANPSAPQSCGSGA